MNVAHTTVIPTNYGGTNTVNNNTQEPKTLCDENDIKQVIGNWYNAQVTSFKSQETVRKAYDVISQINNIWYDMIPVEVIWQEDDPYDSYADMRETVEQEGKLRVFSGGSTPDHMSHSDNIKGRAVHDWFGHLEGDFDFSVKGEWSKYNHVKARYPSWVRGLLFTEIVGQRCAVSYLDGGFGDAAFTQKSVWAPCYIKDLARRAFSEADS